MFKTKAPLGMHLIPRGSRNIKFAYLKNQTVRGIQSVREVGRAKQLRMQRKKMKKIMVGINYGNRTEQSSILFVIKGVINKIGRPRSGSPIFFYECDYRQNWMSQSPVTSQ